MSGHEHVSEWLDDLLLYKVTKTPVIPMTEGTLRGSKAIGNEMAAHPIPDLALGNNANRQLLQCDTRYDVT
jgi:hypothetical protein